MGLILTLVSIDIFLVLWLVAGSWHKASLEKETSYTARTYSWSNDVLLNRYEEWGNPGNAGYQVKFTNLAEDRNVCNRLRFQTSRLLYKDSTYVYLV